MERLTLFNKYIDRFNVTGKFKRQRKIGIQKYIFRLVSYVGLFYKRKRLMTRHNNKFNCSQGLVQKNLNSKKN